MYRSVMILVSSFILFLGILAYGITVFLPDDSGIGFFLRQGLLILIVGCITWLFLRLLNRWIWPRVRALRGKPVPGLLVDCLNFTIITLILLLIMVVILKQPVANLLAAGSLLTAAVAIALQKIILDTIANFIIEADKLMKVGDWVKLEDGTVGQVTRMGWRHVELRTHDHVRVTVPNGNVMQSNLMNYSPPQGWYMDALCVQLESKFPIVRIERIIKSAVLSLTEVVEGRCAVYAHEVNQGNILYTVRYAVADYGKWREMRHLVWQCVMSALHKNNIQTAEKIGEYSISRGNQPFIIQEKEDRLETIQSAELFHALTSHEKQQIAMESTWVHAEKGHVIVQQGDQTDALYIIAEGCVAVALSEDPSQTEVEHEKLLFAGDYFGERALLLGEPRAADVIAKTPVLLCKITRPVVTTILQNNPSIATHLAGIMAERYEELQKSRQTAAVQRKKGTLPLKKMLLKSLQAFFEL